MALNSKRPGKTCCCVGPRKSAIEFVVMVQVCTQQYQQNAIIKEHFPFTAQSEPNKSKRATWLQLATNGADWWQHSRGIIINATEKYAIIQLIGHAAIKSENWHRLFMFYGN